MKFQQNSEQQFFKKNVLKEVFSKAKADYLQAINHLVDVLHQQIQKTQKLFILQEQEQEKQINTSVKQNLNDRNQNQVFFSFSEDKKMRKSIQEQYQKLIKSHNYSKISSQKIIQFFLQNKIHKTLIRHIEKATLFVQKQLQKLRSQITPICEKLKSQSIFLNEKFKTHQNYSQSLSNFSSFFIKFQSLQQDLQSFIQNQNSYSFKKTTQFKSQNIQIVQKLSVESSKNIKLFPIQQPHYIVFYQMMNIENNQFTFKNQSDGFNLNQNQGQQLIFGLIDPINFKNYKNPFYFEKNDFSEESKDIDYLLLKMVCYNKEYYIKNQQMAKPIIYQPYWRRFNIKIQNEKFLLSGIETNIFAYSSQEESKQAPKIYIKTENQRDKLIKQGKKIYEQKKYHKIIEIPLPTCLKNRILKPFIWFKGFHLRVHVFEN